jgi:Uma2 family endonuclease
LKYYPNQVPTKNYDQGDKFLYYRSIPEFKEYILVDQAEYRILQYVKTTDRKWLLTEHQSADEILNLDSVQCQIGLSEIYEKVNFAEIEE